MAMKSVVFQKSVATLTYEKFFVKIPPKMYHVIKRILFSFQPTSAKHFRFGIFNGPLLTALSTFSAVTPGLEWYAYTYVATDAFFPITQTHDASIPFGDYWGFCFYNGAAGNTELFVRIDYIETKDLLDKLVLQTNEY